MLAEIFFLKLEAALRATEEANHAANTRFIPQAPSIMPEAPDGGSRDLATVPIRTLTDVNLSS